MKQVNIGLCGLGTVGGGVFEVLMRNAQEICARANRDIQVVHVGCRRDMPQYDLSSIKVSQDIFAVARDPNVHIVVELIGGTTVAKELVIEAINNGKHVVTANKALIAESGNELFDLADAKGVCIAFEAAVAGGIPIIRALREGLAANKIEWLAGIINGTGNFILTEMRDKGREFDDVLKEAQALGYAEADPTFDVEGIDAAHKLAILASIAFGMPLACDKVFTEGISAVAPQDVKYAEELGYRIKHLGIARAREGKGIELRVHPTLIPAKRLIAQVDGVMNAVLVKGDAVGPTLYYGAGAGAEPTASSVIADIVDVSRQITDDGIDRDAVVPHLGFTSGQIKPRAILSSDEMETAYYLRMAAIDKPGVLSKVTQILSNTGISIEALIQKVPEDDAHWVPVILLTNTAIEKDVMQAIEKIEALDDIDGKVMHLRVESLK